MINIDNDEWSFLDAWGESIEDETELKKEMTIQIAELNHRLNDWADE